MTAPEFSSVEEFCNTPDDQLTAAQLARKVDLWLAVEADAKYDTAREALADPLTQVFHEGERVGREYQRDVNAAYEAIPGHVDSPEWHRYCVEQEEWNAAVRAQPT